MKENIYFLSGLPRTGSTLLTSILAQNPNIYTEGNSALCQLMWDMQVSFWNTEQIKNRPDIPDKLLNNLPHIFYENIDINIIDKCRSWTLPANLELIDRYITKKPKIIVMLRPILDIVKSFVYIRQMNNWENPEQGLLDDNSEPIIRSLNGVNYAKANNKGQFLFIDYNDLVFNPIKTINSIYTFCGWDYYEHNFTNIVNNIIEKDDVLNLIGLHDIRKELSTRIIDVKLSKELYDKALMLDERAI